MIEFKSKTSEPLPFSEMENKASTLVNLIKLLT